MEEYDPKPLAVDPPPQIVALGPRIEDKKFVLVLGAGVSVEPPTCLPSGAELALNVKTRLLDSPLASTVEHVADDNLLAMADIVETKSQAAFPAFIRAILEAADFRMATPNYTHLAIGLLMAETNVPVLSTNWDTCIEQASLSANSYIVACTSRDDIQNAGNSPLLLKLHGCAKNEGSICVSSKQIAEATWWATHQVGAAIEMGFVAFLGIGSIAEYIKLTIQKILEMTKELSNVLVVDPVLSQEWSHLLKDSDKQNIAISSEEFVDDILRTLTLSQLSRANTLAREMKEQSQPSINDVDMVASTRAVIDFFRQYPAHYAWLWVRRGFFATGPNPSILDPTFIQFVLGLSLINHVSPFSHFEIIGDTASIRSEDLIIELAWARDPITAKTLCRKKLASLRTDKKRNVLPQTQRIVVVSHGFVGALPSHIMKESIVAERHLAHIIDGSETLGVSWVDLGELIQGGKKDKIYQMLGVGGND